MSKDRLSVGLSSLELHRRAEGLMFEADKAKAEGNLELTNCLHLSIGSLEARALDRIPLTRPRTRAIIGLSAAASYFDGGDFDNARVIAKIVLDELNNSTFADQDYYKVQLSEIIREINDTHSPSE